MNLQNSLAGGALVKEKTSRNEVQEMLRLVSRWQSDASVKQLSPEGRFNCAYEAALQLATVVLRCAGYRTKGEGHHYVVFDALPDIMGEGVDELMQYFQACRKKRSISVYRKASAVTLAETEELIAEAENFGMTVRRWIKENHPEYS